MTIIITFLGYILWVYTSYSNVKELAVQNFNRGENDLGWNPQQSRQQGLLICNLIVINTFFSSFCNDKAFAVKTLPSFWNPQNDKWPRPTWGENVVYFTFLVIYYGFVNIAGVKWSSGKKEKYPTKKAILPKMPRLKSHHHWCELSKYSHQRLRNPWVFRFFSLHYRRGNKAHTMNQYFAT